MTIYQAPSPDLTQSVLVATRADWTALAEQIERNERASGQRPNLAIPNRIRAALAASDDAMVRVTMTESVAATILGRV